jgi:hypothetical protein
MVYLKAIVDVSTSRQPTIIFGMPYKAVITLEVKKRTLKPIAVFREFFSNIDPKKVMRK